MKITKKDATEIVNELSGLIGMKINIIGSDSIIIANSNPARVGDFHEASHKIITQKLDELVVYNDRQYKGSIPGTNLPLVIDGEIIGVIGVTGPYQVASSYGKIIKRMAEIMLRSRAEADRKQRQCQLLERFCTAWVCSTHTEINEDFIQKGNSLEIDVTQPRRIVTVSSKDNDNDSLYGTIRNYIGNINPKYNVFLASYSIVIILDDMLDNRIQTLLDDMVAELSSMNLSVYIGVDNGCSSYMQIHRQYERAKIALNTALRLQSKSVVFYNELGLEILLDEISLKSKIRYIKKIFKGEPLLEIKRMMHIVSVLYEENGSLKQAAVRLIMHPNTLQYQLKKIEDKTGYDPRKLSNADIFGVVSLFLSELQNQLQEEDFDRIVSNYNDNR